MKNSIPTLKNFIESAERSRKYPHNSAKAYLVALNLFEAELNEEERADIDKFKENLPSIYSSVFEKNKTKYSTGSLDAYRKRVSKLLSDYFTYGQDPGKMASWKPAVRTVGQTRKSARIKEPIVSAEEQRSIPTGGLSGDRIEWTFTEDRKALLILPFNMDEHEAETLRTLINLRAGKTKEGKDVSAI